MATREDMKTFIKNMKTIKRDFSKKSEEILDELVDISVKEMENSVSSSNYEASEPVSVFKESIETKKRISGISGAQAIYDEFGTGTIGQNNPHPNKSQYDLNEYNSGKTIRLNVPTKNSLNSTTKATEQGIPPGGLYWTYMYNGKKIYTQGRPAGKHVFKAHKEVKDNMGKIIEKKVGDLLSNL